MIDEAGDDDALDRSDFVPAEGGEWRGLLFENPTLGLAPQLTWSFHFPFQPVSRDQESSPLTLDVEWLPIPADGWRSMTGRSASSSRFAEPGEASVYHFAHHRYDAIHLQILEQRDLAIHVRANVSGDLDGLGVESVAADAWLDFAGITVALRDMATADAALARLSEFSDITGLAHAAVAGGIHYRFAPSGLVG
ncbi:hypothetical protein ABZ754_19420 [Micromonospora purpureochromogenes]|uniref:hypothetical protein n=1 Tax=Micromonospora purpureochromogenes TaxID=47872 RepID=UPI0033F47337